MVLPQEQMGTASGMQKPRFCQNSGLIDDGVAIHAGVHHAALTFSINSRHREMNTSRRADDDAGVWSILK